VKGLAELNQGDLEHHDMAAALFMPQLRVFHLWIAPMFWGRHVIDPRKHSIAWDLPPAQITK